MIYTFSMFDDFDDSFQLERPAAADFRSDVERDYPLVQQHDATSLDIGMAERMARELIYVSGGEIDLFQRTDNSNIDNVWDEDPDPTYWAAERIKGSFPPKLIELALKQWGSDAVIKLEVHFSLRDLTDRFGARLIRPGDVLLLPYNAIGNVTPKYFRVVNASPYGNYRYMWLYLQCNVESIAGDVTVVPRDVGLQVSDQQGE